MREEPAFPFLPFRVRKQPGVVLFSLDLEIGRVIPPAAPIEIGVSAVLSTVTGRRSHWALLHPGPRPDFHRREGFAVKIPAD